MRLQLRAEVGPGDAFARDHEDRVLAGDRPEDVRMPGAVDLLGERLREAGRGRDQAEVAARLAGPHRAPGPAAEVAEPVAVGRAGRRVDEPSPLVPHLDEAELV